MFKFFSFSDDKPKTLRKEGEEKERGRERRDSPFENECFDQSISLEFNLCNFSFSRTFIFLNNFVLLNLFRIGNFSRNHGVMVKVAAL